MKAPTHIDSRKSVFSIQCDILINNIAKAKAAEIEATQARQAAVRDFARHIKKRIAQLNLDRGTLRRRLGWPDARLGNFLHLDYCLTPEWMAELSAALGPRTAAERKIAKRQPKRTKALNS
jgi:hypothetical protein